jgi:hypothetical protein
MPAGMRDTAVEGGHARLVAVGRHPVYSPVYSRNRVRRG